MSGSWLDISGPSGSRRETLHEGLTRIGASGADIRLEGTGSDQLHVWNQPPRMIFMGAGERPTRDGQAFDEHDLVPGDRVRWAGHELVYGGEAAAADLAPLEELPGVQGDARAQPHAGVSPEFLRSAARVRAGMACELGLVDRKTMKHWREAVMASRFDPDACARELLPPSPGPDTEQRLLERSGTLLRDFLMAAQLTGLAGVRRKVREKTRNLVAFVIAQGIALLVFALIVVAILLVVRYQGRSIDELLDRVLPG